MPNLKIRINHLQVYGFYQIVTVLFFGIFGLFISHSAKTTDQTTILMSVAFLSLFGALMFTVATSLFINSQLSPNGIVYGNLLLGEETLGWDEIDDVRSQIGFPYYILRKRLPVGISIKFEEVNNVWGAKVCCLPKLAFVKDQEEFVAYLDKMLPPDHKL